MTVAWPTTTGVWSFDEVARKITALPPPTAPGQREANLNLIGRLARPEQTLSILDDVLEDDDALSRIANRSYRHVNHFEKIVLVDSGRLTDYRLTLHLWLPPYSAEEHDDEMIHDHRFSFWSAILAGTLESVNFETAADGQPFRRYRYRPVKQEESTVQNSYDFDGDCPLAVQERLKETAGGRYYLNYQQIHRVLLPFYEVTCTLVLRGPRERDFSTVYNTSYPAQDLDMVNAMFGSDKLAGMLNTLRGELVTQQLAAR